MDERTPEEIFEENALKPKKVETDSGKIEQHSISDQLKALDHISKKKYEGKSQLSRFGFYKIRNLD